MILRSKSWILVFVIVSCQLQIANCQKVLDGVIAVVGASPILESEVQAKRVQAKMDSIKYDRCVALEDLLYQKLLLAQAIKDSVTVSDEQVEDELDRRLRYYINQFGSIKAFEEFYGKSMERFKIEFKDELRDVMLVQKMQAKVTEGVTISPSEIKEFFDDIPKDSVPLINAEIEIGHITRSPKVNPELKKYAKDKIEEIRREIIEGKKDFATAAILYSMDPGSAPNGGLYKNYQRGGGFVPEFEAVAFKMKESNPPIIFEDVPADLNKIYSSKKDTAKFITMKGKILWTINTKDGIDSLLVQLLTQDGDIIQTSVTDSTGSFKFEKVAADKKYSIKLDKTNPKIMKIKKVYLYTDSNKPLKSIDINVPIVSDVFESEYGYHILTVDSRRGEEIDVRHILIIPQPSSDDLNNARVFLDSIADLVRKDSISLTEAASRFSDDEETKHNGGLITNPYTGTTKFEMDQISQIDPTLVFTIDKLKTGELSQSMVTQSRDGRQSYHVLFVKSRTEPHRANLKDDYQRIQEEALAAKKDRITNEWIKKKLGTTYVRISDEYKNCKFDNKWIQ